jgi:DDE superfamily endonuclease
VTLRALLCATCGALPCSRQETYQLRVVIALGRAHGLRCTLGLVQLVASDPEAEHVVVYDLAGFHLRPGDARVPARVHPVRLPPYSPELNRVAGVWDYAQNATCNRVFATLEKLQAAVPERFAAVLGGARPGVTPGASLAARSSKQFVQTHYAELR